MKKCIFVITIALCVGLSSNLAFGVGEKTWREWLSAKFFGKSGTLYGLNEKIADIKEELGIQHSFHGLLYNPFGTDKLIYSDDQLNSYHTQLTEISNSSSTSALGKKAAQQIKNELDRELKIRSDENKRIADQKRKRQEENAPVLQGLLEKTGIDGVINELDNMSPSLLFVTIYTADEILRQEKDLSKKKIKTEGYLRQEKDYISPWDHRWQNIREKFNTAIIKKLGGWDNIQKIKIQSCYDVKFDGMSNFELLGSVQKSIKNIIYLIYTDKNWDGWVFDSLVAWDTDENTQKEDFEKQRDSLSKKLVSKVIESNKILCNQVKSIRKLAAVWPERPDAKYDNICNTYLEEIFKGFSPTERKIFDIIATMGYSDIVCDKSSR